MLRNVTHPDGFNIQRGFEIACGDGEIILRHDLLGIGVKVAAHRRNQVGKLGGRETRAAAKHHVFEGVRHAGKTGWRFVRTHQVIELSRHHRGQRVAHDHHAQAVFQRRPRYIRFRSGLRPGDEGQESRHHLNRY